MRLIFTTLAVLFFGFIHAQKTKVYNPKLNIISNIEDYKKSINENPDNELVDLEDFVPGIILDIRYATDNNFTGRKIYLQPKAYARYPVAKALLFVQQELEKHNYSLKVFDAYRPYAATALFYEIYKDTTYVASPWSGSRHNRGAAVDISIVDNATGEEIQMPTGFDAFNEAAHPDFMDLPENVIENRQLLITIMQKHGFRVYPSEWWHYDFVGWQAFPLMDISFEELQKDDNN